MKTFICFSIVFLACCGFKTTVQPLLRMTGETSSDALTFKKMLQHGLNGAPRGSLNLSFEEFQELLKYIEENF